MATSKRERQKAARREKLERMQRHAQRRKNSDAGTGPFNNYDEWRIVAMR